MALPYPKFLGLALPSPFQLAAASTEQVLIFYMVVIVTTDKQKKANPDILELAFSLIKTIFLWRPVKGYIRRLGM